ncbi:equilibrative nucleotide transporter 6 [Quercus suber]|uniref:Equilibrative nucleotide transporter 6 n=1 Tax=Quercus suber TaxID=58331 RepID=A0AAW0KUR2_QUESU
MDDHARILLGTIQRYLTVCVLTVAPKGYKAPNKISSIVFCFVGPEQNALGNLLVLCLLGVYLQELLLIVVDNRSWKLLRREVHNVITE